MHLPPIASKGTSPLLNVVSKLISRMELPKNHSWSPRKCQKATFSYHGKMAKSWAYGFVAPHFVLCAHLHNTVPMLDTKALQLEKCSSNSVGFNKQHFHAFACLVFAPHSNLASGSRIPKWYPRARLGLNLGHSLFNAPNINLVLNLSTSLVSPQYHCKDNDFLRQYNTTRWIPWYLLIFEKC